MDVLYVMFTVGNLDNKLPGIGIDLSATILPFDLLLLSHRVLLYDVSII